MENASWKTFDSMELIISRTSRDRNTLEDVASVEDGGRYISREKEGSVYPRALDRFEYNGMEEGEEWMEVNVIRNVKQS